MNSVRSANNHDKAQGRHATRVGVLLVKNLGDALRYDDLGSAISELQWLSPDQFIERDGRIRLLPGTSSQLLEHAKANRVHPLGVVFVDEHGVRTDVLIAGPIATEYLDVAKRLLRDHVSFWLLRASGPARGAADES